MSSRRLRGRGEKKERPALADKEVRRSKGFTEKRYVTDWFHLQCERTCEKHQNNRKDVEGVRQLEKFTEQETAVITEICEDFPENALKYAVIVFTHGDQLQEGVTMEEHVEQTFCWAFSFACTLLVLLVELFGLQARAPMSWTNFPITFACYACLLCLSASVIFPLFFLKYQNSPGEARDHRIAATVFLCLATVAYMGEVAGYMATAPGLLKVCQTSVACILFLLVCDPVTYDRHTALKWCMAVYCICFILSVAVVVLCVGECTGRLPVPFSCT
uniref:myeloid-associated differentiation marker homolog n=1 Tax=Gasterosteus aculeatus aculeatus TaxID=481459 RepID=UPI001A9860B9|nr:myeloid-associated differentiation marker homolog [Gasterosteus aculeatus aculeatus]